MPPPTNTSCCRKCGAYCCCCYFNNVDMVWCRMPNATGCPHAPPLQVCLAPHVSHAARREQGAASLLLLPFTRRKHALWQLRLAAISQKLHAAPAEHADEPCQHDRGYAREGHRKSRAGADIDGDGSSCVCCCTPCSLTLFPVALFCLFSCCMLLNVCRPHRALLAARVPPLAGSGQQPPRPISSHTRKRSRTQHIVAEMRAPEAELLPVTCHPRFLYFGSPFL